MRKKTREQKENKQDEEKNKLSLTHRQLSVMMLRLTRQLSVTIDKATMDKDWNIWTHFFTNNMGMHPQTRREEVEGWRGGEWGEKRGGQRDKPTKVLHKVIKKLKIREKSCCTCPFFVSLLPIIQLCNM